jgi:hypothetical protein
MGLFGSGTIRIPLKTTVLWRLPAMRIARFVAPVLLLATVFASSACTPMATYPPESKAEPALPWMYPIPQVMAKSLASTYNKTVETVDGTQPALVYNLPAGIPVGVWKQVAIDTGVENARPATAEDMLNGTPIWTVERIAVRGQRAQVDVVYPDRKIFQLASVTLRAKPLQPFHVAAFQRFLIAKAMPEVNNPMGAIEELEPTAVANTDDTGE